MAGKLKVFIAAAVLSGLFIAPAGDGAQAAEEAGVYAIVIDCAPGKFPLTCSHRTTTKLDGFTACRKFIEEAVANPDPDRPIALGRCRSLSPPRLYSGRQVR
ncbi:MAG: hypothetical protein ACE5FR_08780 [Rhodospirillales bacterium]